MMDIANTLKGLLPKIGFTWNTLLRLFYSLCGWLVIGTLIPITGASGHTPVGTLRRLLDRLGAPSSFTFGMEDWCGSHACLLTMSGLVVLAVSILATAAVASGGAWGEVFAGLEAPVFLFGLSLLLQSGAPARLWGVCIVIAWASTAARLGFFAELPAWLRNLRYVIPFDDEPISDFLVWPASLVFALFYPLLTLVRLLLDGMPSKGV